MWCEEQHRKHTDDGKNKPPEGDGEAFLYLESRCGGYSSWCRCPAGCTRTQTWMNPEQQTIKARSGDSGESKSLLHLSWNDSYPNSSTKNPVCVRLTSMRQPRDIAVASMVKFTPSTWPTAEVWLAWMRDAVTGPSWITNTWRSALTWWPSPEYIDLFRQSFSPCTSPWL